MTPDNAIVLVDDVSAVACTAPPVASPSSVSPSSSSSSPTSSSPPSSSSSLPLVFAFVVIFYRSRIADAVQRSTLIVFNHWPQCRSAALGSVVGGGG